MRILQLPSFSLYFAIQCLGLCCLIGCTSFAQDHASLDRITVKGNQFVNETGETMVFRGLNTSDPDKLATEGHWNKRYFKK